MREVLTKRNILFRTSLSIEETYHPPNDQVEKKHRVDCQGSPEIINFSILSLIPLGSYLAGAVQSPRNCMDAKVDQQKPR